MAEREKEVTKSSSTAAIALLEEKLTREYGISLEQLRAGTITIKNGEVTVKVKEK